MKKQDERGKWRKWWVQLKSAGLYFFKEKVEFGNLNEVIKISDNTKCVLVQRRMYSYRFKLCTDKGTHILKCDSVFHRNNWMYVIELVSKGLCKPEIPLRVEPVMEDTPEPDNTWMFRRLLPRTATEKGRRNGGSQNKRQDKTSKGKKGFLSLTCALLPWTFRRRQTKHSACSGSSQCLIGEHATFSLSGGSSTDTAQWNEDNFAFYVD